MDREAVVSAGPTQGRLFSCYDFCMQPIEQRIADLEKKIDAMSVIVKRLYTIFLVTVVLTVLGFVAPLIGLAFVIPKFIAGYGSMLGI